MVLLDLKDLFFPSVIRVVNLISVIYLAHQYLNIMLLHYTISCMKTVDLSFKD